MINVSEKEFGKLITSHPVLLLSSRSGRRNNLAPLIWYSPMSSEPPLLGISLKPSSMSFHYVRESGDFVVAVCHETMVREVHFCGVNSGRDLEKLRYMNISTQWGIAATPMILPDSLANLECRVRSITPTGDRQWIVGEVKAATANAEYFEDGWIEDTPLLHYVEGNKYRCGEVFYDMSDVRPGLINENY
jgi:flavin reductase (DIM6/NTAB) family NADH-FMN oxidoreductase RutF